MERIIHISNKFLEIGNKLQHNHIMGFYAVIKSCVFEHYLINCGTLLIITPSETK